MSEDDNEKTYIAKMPTLDDETNAGSDSLLDDTFDAHTVIGFSLKPEPEPAPKAAPAPPVPKAPPAPARAPQQAAPAPTPAPKPASPPVAPKAPTAPPAQAAPAKPVAPPLPAAPPVRAAAPQPSAPSRTAAPARPAQNNLPERDDELEMPPLPKVRAPEPAPQPVAPVRAGPAPEAVAPKPQIPSAPPKVAPEPAPAPKQNYAPPTAAPVAQTYQPPAAPSAPMPSVPKSAPAAVAAPIAQSYSPVSAPVAVEYREQMDDPIQEDHRPTERRIPRSVMVGAGLAVVAGFILYFNHHSAAPGSVEQSSHTAVTANEKPSDEGSQPAVTPAPRESAPQLDAVLSRFSKAFSQAQLDSGSGHL